MQRIVKTCSDVGGYHVELLWSEVLVMVQWLFILKLGGSPFQFSRANGVSVEGSQIPCDATPMCDAHAAEESLEHSRTIPMQAHLISIS